MNDGPFVIAQISDTHFGTVDPPVREALLADLAAAPPQVIVLTGDVTQRARRAQFAAARAFLDALPAGATRLAIPGNHDIALLDLVSRVFTPYRLFRRYVSHDLEPSFDDGHVSITCVDATRRWRHKHGTLDAAQVARVAARLREVRAEFRIVATHQPVVARLDKDVRNLARGAAAALQSWIPAGADLFLGGHIHLPYCVPASTPDARRQAIVLQAGTSLSTRIRAGIPNSYNRIHLYGQGSQRRMELERRDFQREATRFATHFVHRAALGPCGWALAE